MLCFLLEIQVGRAGSQLEGPDATARAEWACASQTPRQPLPTARPHHPPRAPPRPGHRTCCPSVPSPKLSGSPRNPLGTTVPPRQPPACGRGPAGGPAARRSAEALCTGPALSPGCRQKPQSRLLSLVPGPAGQNHPERRPLRGRRCQQTQSSLQTTLCTSLGVTDLLWGSFLFLNNGHRPNKHSLQNRRNDFFFCRDGCPRICRRNRLSPCKNDFPKSHRKSNW